MSNVVRLQASGEISFKDIADNAKGGLANVAMNIYGALYGINTIDNNDDPITEFYGKCACLSVTLTNNTDPPVYLSVDYRKCDGELVQESIPPGESITKSIIRGTQGGGASVTEGAEDC